MGQASKALLCRSNFELAGLHRVIAGDIRFKIEANCRVSIQLAYQFLARKADFGSPYAIQDSKTLNAAM